MKARALVVLAGCAMLTGCNWMFADLGSMNPPCEEKHIRDYASPDGRRKAVEIHSKCEGGAYPATIEIAATASGDRATAMHASLHERTKSPAWPELKVEWKSAKELWIMYPAGVDAQCISSPPGVTVHCIDASVRR